MPPRSRERFALFAPLKFVLAYLLVTISIAVLGPIDYFQFPVLRTLFFMACVMTAMWIGYLHAVRVGVRPTSPERAGTGLMVQRLFDFSLGISLLALAVSTFSSFRSGSLNTDISAIGDAYVSAYQGYERNTGLYSTQFIIYSMALPFNAIAMVWGFYYFKRFSFARRSLVIVLAVSGPLFSALSTGTQKQIGDVLIYLIAVAAVKYGVRGKPISLKTVSGAAAFGIVSVITFVAVLGQRYAALGVDIGNINNRASNNIFIDTSHPVFKIFGPDYGLTLAMFSSYLSQGYYGLGLALQTDWTWTRFTGFSYSLSILANRLFGMEWQWPNTLVYQVGVTTGWGESKWSTVFPYFATDFTFPGTVLLFGYFAYVYARSWLASIHYQNPFAILVFSLMTLGVFFMPANNQLLHSPGALFTTLLFTGFYLVLAGRYNGAAVAKRAPVPTRSGRVTPA